MITVSHLNYGHPEYFWLIGVIALFLLLYGYLESYRERNSIKYASSSQMKDMRIAPSNFRRWLKIAFLCLAWLCGVWALMLPRDEGHYLEEDLIAPNPQKASNFSETQSTILRKKAHDVIFLLDASKSMEVSDTRLGKTRFDYAKEIIDALLSQLQGENAALYTFTSLLDPKVPSTLDYLYVHLISDEVEIDEGGIPGTDLKTTFEALLEKLSEEPGQRHYTIILLSDGEDTQLASLQGPLQNRRRDAILSALEKAQGLNLRIISIGIGSNSGGVIPNLIFSGDPVISKRNDLILKQIAQKTGGDLIDSNNETPSQIASQAKILMKKDRSIYEDSKETLRKVLATSSTEHLIFTEYFQWPLGFAVLFLTFGIGISERQSRRTSHVR